MNQISDTFNGLMKEISERRSVRRYTDAPVDDQLLNRLLEVAGHTQTMGNLQLYSVVVTRSEEKKRQLAPAHFNQPMVTQAPVVLTFCADYCRTTAWCEQRKATPGYGKPLQIISALQLPKLVMPVATITLGWPDETPATSDRLPLTAIMHEETYKAPTAESIDRDYALKESLPENKAFVEVNKKETLAQVFADVRYTKKDCEAMSVELLKALKQQGFMGVL